PTTASSKPIWAALHWASRSSLRKWNRIFLISSPNGRAPEPMSPMDSILSPFFQSLEHDSVLRWEGKVTQVLGQLIESAGPICSVGECCEIIDSGQQVFPGEIVGFRGPIVLSMALNRPAGIRYGDRIVTWGSRPVLRVSPDLLGRVIDGAGKPLDALPPPRAREHQPLDTNAPLPLNRVPIRDAIGTGVRAVDAFITCGRGQRLGIFGGSGVGKSTLLGMMAR